MTSHTRAKVIAFPSGTAATAAASGDGGQADSGATCSPEACSNGCGRPRKPQGRGGPRSLLCELCIADRNRVRKRALPAPELPCAEGCGRPRREHPPGTGGKPSDLCDPCRLEHRRAMTSARVEKYRERQAQVGAPEPASVDSSGITVTEA